jgi:hypothetical protein
MPCRCCGASRPSKGFNEPDEKKIHRALKYVASLVLAKDHPVYENIDEWKKGWQEAFDHMLNGCDELDK